MCYMWMYDSFHMQVDKEVNPTEIAEYRSLSSSLQMMEEIKSKDSEGAKAKLRTRYGLRDDPNPMLKLPADLYRYD